MTDVGPAPADTILRASDVPPARGSVAATLLLIVCVICLLIPAPEYSFRDESPRQAAELLEEAAELAEEDEYRKRDLNKVVDALSELIALTEATGITPDVEGVIADMRAAIIELSAQIEAMRGRDRAQPPLPGLSRLAALEGHFDDITAANRALEAFAEIRLNVTAVLALALAVFLVLSPAFHRQLNEVPVFGAPAGSLPYGVSRGLVRAVILLCGAAIVMVFQPNLSWLFPIGMGLVVLGGLAFNLVPLAQPGRLASGVTRAALIVAVVFVIVVLLALGSAELYSLYLESLYQQSN